MRTMSRPYYITPQTAKSRCTIIEKGGLWHVTAYVPSLGEMMTYVRDTEIEARATAYRIGKQIVDEYLASKGLPPCDWERVEVEERAREAQKEGGEK